MNGAIARIALRYLAAFLVARGILPADVRDGIFADPELVDVLQAGIGVAIGATVEGWYAIAKRYGWRT